MRGALSPLQRSRIQSQVHAARVDQIELFIPTYQKDLSLYDTFTGELKDITQNPQDTSWHKSVVQVRIAHGRDMASLISFKGVVEINDPGDIYLSAEIPDKGAFEKARDTKGAYALIDNEKYRVASVERNRVEGVTSLVVVCKLTTPSARA